MEEAIEKIVNDAMKTIQYFEDCDKYAILSEASIRLQQEGSKALEREYLKEGKEDTE